MATEEGVSIQVLQEQLNTRLNVNNDNANNDIKESTHPPLLSLWLPFSRRLIVTRSNQVEQIFHPTIDRNHNSIEGVFGGRKLYNIREDEIPDDAPSINRGQHPSSVSYQNAQPSFVSHRDDIDSTNPSTGLLVIDRF